MAEEQEEKLSFNHQCYLMDYADILAGYNKNCQYENFHAFSLEQAGTHGEETVHDICARLMRRTGLKRINKLTPDEQGMLQPKVRLWRVFPAKATGAATDEEGEFIFESVLNDNSLDSITAGTARHPEGLSGIKKFEWEFGGTNPAEAEAVIMVKMTLHFHNIHELSRGWGDVKWTDSDGNEHEAGSEPGSEQRPSFMELILLPPGSKLDNGEYDPMFYKIKAEVGWAVPPFLSELDAELMRELRDTRLVMYLNLITHEIKVKEDGSIDVEVEYVGSTEAALESNTADVIFPIGSEADAVVDDGWWFTGIGSDNRTIQDVEAEIEALESQLDEISDECDEGGELSEEQDEILEELADLSKAKRKVTANNRSQAYETFTQNLSKRIRHLDIKNGEIHDWQENPQNIRPNLAASLSIGDQGWFSNPEKEAEAADATDPADDDIYFVYLGDILEQACMSFGPAAQEVPSNPCRFMKMLAGPCQFINPRTHNATIESGDPPDIVSLNLADVPISYTMFLEFWNDNVVDAERDSYPVRTFIRDVIQRIVAPAFQNSCFPNAPGQQVTVSTSVFTVDAPGSNNGVPRDLIGELARDKTGRVPTVDLAEFMADNASIGGEDGPGWNYIFLYMNTGAIGTGDQREDENRGIYHFRIGEDRGLLKKLDFKKSDIQGLKESRQASEGAISQLREVYNADVSLLGNNIFIPGMTCFLHPPPGLGNPADCNSDANRLGLGGYYNVIKVRSTIKRGGHYDTKLDCIFTATTSENCNPDAKKCETSSSSEPKDSGWGWLEDLGDDVVDAITGGGGSEGIDDETGGDCEGKASGGFGNWSSWW